MIIQPHDTWSIHDSSKLELWVTCRRKYFYKALLGWELDVPNHDTYFGQAVHLAREYQLLNGYSDIQGAYNIFIDFYRKEFQPGTDDIYRPKDPAGVLTMLLSFNEQQSRDLEENEVVELDGTKMTEISGAVPISDKRVLHYRMDSIMRRLEDGMIFSWDWKTTSEKYINGRQWAENFFLSLQNGTYTHCLYCMFPIEQVLGIEFYGIGFAHLSRGSANRSAGYHCSFRKVPAFKTPEQMNTWLWTVNTLMDEIEMEMDRLQHCKESDAVMMAFPMNPTSCTDYRGCAYHDFCLSWQNPLQQCDEPPLGFKQEFWNPAKQDTRVKKNLEWR
jgi:hypothetical protein